MLARKRGFTLVELLVVIAIIGPWMAGGLTAFPSALQGKSISSWICPSDTQLGGATAGGESFGGQIGIKPSQIGTRGPFLAVSNYLGVFSGLNDGEAQNEPASRKGAFRMNTSRSFAEFTDGTSNTPSLVRRDESGQPASPESPVCSGWQLEQ